MNPARILLAAVVITGLQSTASAVNKVWWEAVPKNANSLVLQQGEGQRLELVCGDGTPVPERCEWNVTMYLRNDQGISGWANDLGTMPDIDALFVKDFEYMSWYDIGKGPPYYYPFDYVNVAATPGSGDALLTGTAGYNLWTAGPPPAWYPNGYPLVRFTLSFDTTQEWFLWNDIYTTIGAWEWSGDTEDVWVEFGGNAAVNANTAGVMPANPVMRVWIPEPATISMLALGAMFLARRRRSGGRWLLGGFGPQARIAW
jgi:hypothetical protein